MHSTKKLRVKNPKLTKNGLRRGRKALGEETFTATVHLDVRSAQWLQRQAHNTHKSRSSIMRELIAMAMRMERETNPRSEAYQDEKRMDSMAGGA